MLYNLATSELDCCARTIARIGDDQPEHVRASLAWLIRNRLQFVASSANIQPNVAQTCQEIVCEAVGEPKTPAAEDLLPNVDWCRLFAVTCQVWAGDLPDETGGATSCHRHDRAPAWAKHRSPTALIGPYLFYR
jgi:hypothetical protein